MAESVLVKALAAFLVVGFTCAIAIFGFGLIIKEIQDQRFDSLVLSCEETNARNKEVNSQIDKAVEENPPKTKKEKDESDAGVAAFRLIIGAAVPYTEDCKAYARDRVKGYF